jgi:hypothetical protein
VIRHEANLAWALALAAKPHVDAAERNDIFVAIGADDTFAAIRELIKCVAIRGIPMGPDLVRGCVSWLDAYVGHEDERYLRRLVEDFVFSKRDSSFGNVRGPTGCRHHPGNEPSRPRLQGVRHTAPNRETHRPNPPAA